MKIKILKENFPGDFPTGPSLGHDNSLPGASWSETDWKIYYLVKNMDEELDKLENYTGFYNHVVARWINLKPRPKTRTNQHGSDEVLIDEKGDIAYHTKEETGVIIAKQVISRGSLSKKDFNEIISHSTEVATILQAINQYLVLIDTVGFDRQMARHIESHLYEKRVIKFKYTGNFVRDLFGYGDYLAAAGFFLESMAEAQPDLDASIGQSIRDTAESFKKNFNDLWKTVKEELAPDGGYLQKRRSFIEKIEPEILKFINANQQASYEDLKWTDFGRRMFQKYPLDDTSQVTTKRAADFLIRKALRNLVEKDYIVPLDKGEDFFADTVYIINPQMVQQIGREVFPKPKGIMENDMKLNTSTINKLILEELENLQEFRREPTKQEMKSVFEDSLKKAARDTAKYVGMDNNKDFIDLLIKTFKSDSFNKKIISNLKNNKVNESNDELESSLLHIDSFLKSPEGEEYKKGIEDFNTQAKEKTDQDIKKFVDSKFNDAFEYEGLDQLASYMMTSAIGGAIGGAGITLVMMTLAVMMPEIASDFGVTQGTFEKGAMSAIIWVPLLLSGVIMPLMWAMHNAITLKNNLELKQIKKTSEEVNQEIANLQIEALKHIKEVEFADKVIEAEIKKAREANDKNSPYFRGIENLKNKYQSSREIAKSNEESDIERIKVQISKLFSKINHQYATTSNTAWRKFQSLFQNKNPDDMRPFYDYMTHMLRPYITKLQVKDGKRVNEVPVEFETFLEGPRGSKLFDDMFYFVSTATKTTGNTKGKIEVNDEKLSALKKIKDKRKVITKIHAKFASNSSVSWADNEDNIEYVKKGINSYDELFKHLNNELKKLEKMEEILKDPKLAGEKVGEIVGGFYSDYFKMIRDREARERSKRLDQRLKPNEEEVEISDDDDFQDKKFDKKTMGKIAQQQGRRLQREDLNDKRKMKIKILKEATGEQKRQQKSAEYTSQQKQRRKIKARIRRSQNNEVPSHKNDLPSFQQLEINMAIGHLENNPDITDRPVPGFIYDYIEVNKPHLLSRVIKKD